MLGSPAILSTKRLGQMPPMVPVQWRAIYCGVTEQLHNGLLLQVYFHEEQTQATAAQVASNMDSFLGFATLLGFARKGLWS